MTEPVRTYRWRRRAVMPVRATWVAMVIALFLMAHRAFLQAQPALGQGLKVLSFIVIVVLPTLALILWRFGLLPPERVEATFDE